MTNKTKGTYKNKIYTAAYITEAANLAYKNLMEQYSKKSEYVYFYNGKHSRKSQNSFDAYHYANLKA